MKSVSIVGGGLVGSMAAIRLKQLGYEVEIFEKRPDPRIATTTMGRSINLIITSRGFNTLKQAGLYEKVLLITKAVGGRRIHDLTGNEAYQAYGRDKSECNYSISRADLNQFLLTEAEALGIKIYFSQEIENIDFKTQLLKFSDKSPIKGKTYHHVLATDGAGSVFRKAFHQTIANYQDSTEFIHSDYKELFMPLSKEATAQLDVEALHIWPRGTHMMMALPNLDGSFTMTIYLPRDGSKGDKYHFEMLKSEQAVEDFFKAEFPDVLSKIPRLSQSFLINPQGKLGTVRSAPWVYEDKVALLGDAAHAIVPFFGQGMNLGFEDVHYFCKFLLESNHNWSSALSQFDNFQRPNANAIAEMALENFHEMREKVGDKTFLLTKKVEAKLEASFPELYRARYGMITYTLTSYALCQKVGLIQEEILSELTKGITSPDDVDMYKAKVLIQEKLQPFIQKNQINLKNWQLL